MARSEEFKGKVVVVTGAGTGIGRAIACKFAASGAHAVLAGRREAKLRETLALIERDGGNALVHPTDVTDEPSVRSLVSAATAITGHVDVQVNNAGITAVAEATPDALEQNMMILETNLNALLRLVTLMLPHVPDGGRIINMASLLSTHPKPRSAAYSASKHGVIGLTKALAIDLAPRRITVNAICPGWVDTEMSQGVMAAIAKVHGVTVERIMQQMTHAMPLGRMVEADEVAAVAAFLAGPAGAMITGQSITICGGSSLM